MPSLRSRGLDFAVGAPFVLFAILAISLSVNIPQQDDYDSILFYLINAQDNALNGLTDIHVSHRLVATRILAWIGVNSWGQLELRSLMWLGTLALFASILLLYRSLTGARQGKFLLAIISLCMLSLFHWSNIVWATAAIQNYLGLFCAVSAIYLYAEQSKYWITLALLIGVVAPYVSSNGLLILPIFAIWSGLSRQSTGELHGKVSRFAGAVPVAVLSAFSFLIYFYGFEQSFSFGDSFSLQESLFTAILQVGKAYLIASAAYLHFDALALTAGAIINAYFLYLIVKRYDQRNPRLFYCISYLMMSVALVALFRYQYGSDALGASRYQVFTLTLLALMIVSFFETGLSKQFPFLKPRASLLALCALLYLASWFYLGNLWSERNKILNGLQEWQSTGNVTGLYHPEPERAARILNRAMELGIYQ